MKRKISIAICIIVFSIISCNAFALTPPSAVTKAFATKFPTAQKVRWGKEGKTKYEANFSLEGIAMSANFLATGEWLETETEIQLSEIPGTVISSIMKKYPSCKITGGDRIMNSKCETTYETDLTISSKKLEVQCDSKGNFVH